MPRAVLKNGLIQPVEPLPLEWSDGTELQVERVETLHELGNGVESARWMSAVEKLAERIDPAEDVKLEQAIAAIRQQGKDTARRISGLDE